MQHITKLGESATSNRTMKPIEVLHFINETSRNPDQRIKDVGPSDRCKFTEWDNIMLLNQGELGDLDTFIGWDNDRPLKGYIYLGHWNDGVV